MANNKFSALLLILCVLFLAIAWIDGSRQQNKEIKTEPNSPQYNNSNPSNWSGVYVGEFVVKDRL